MKKTLKILSIYILTAILLNCGTTVKMIEKKSVSEKTDVFYEVTDNSLPQKGYADIIIKASIKTHLNGFYPLESKKSSHGKDRYPFLINIDGQSALFFTDGVVEEKPVYDNKGKKIKDAEAGKGIKYTLSKKIRIKAGSNKVFFALPADKFYTEVEITLKDGMEHTLEFVPVYRQDSWRIESFLKGIKNYVVKFDGKIIEK